MIERKEKKRIIVFLPQCSERCGIERKGKFMKEVCDNI